MKPGDTLPGEAAFKLYDTFGFPYDLTEDALRAQGLGVDRAGFDAAMARAEGGRARRLEGLGRRRPSEDVWFDIAEEQGATEFTGYLGHEGEGVVVALVKDGARVEQRRRRRQGRHPDQPDALLRRKRRPDRRHRKDQQRQGPGGRC